MAAEWRIGLGLGLGSPQLVPDDQRLHLRSLSGELGLIGGIAIICLYMVLVARAKVRRFARR